MSPTLGEPDSPEICLATAYIKLFRWRPTSDHLVAHQPQPQSQYFPGIRHPGRAGPYLRALFCVNPTWITDLGYSAPLIPGRRKGVTKHPSPAITRGGIRSFGRPPGHGPSGP